MISGILLAAGKSARFGANTLLFQHNGVSIGLRSALNLVQHVDELISVVNPNDVEFVRLLHKHGIQTVGCENATLGMHESIRSGVQAAKPENAILIALADMPYIHINSYRAIVNSMQGPFDVVAPYYQEQRGHPVGFATACRNELLSLVGNHGARTVINHHMHGLLKVHVNDPGVVSDIDTMADLDRFALIGERNEAGHYD